MKHFLKKKDFCNYLYIIEIAETMENVVKRLKSEGLSVELISEKHSCKRNCGCNVTVKIFGCRSTINTDVVEQNEPGENENRLERRKKVLEPQKNFVKEREYMVSGIIL